MSGWDPNATLVETEVVEENGRFVVYLKIDFFEPDKAGDEKFSTVRHRIQAYAKRQQAELAAKWIQRTTNRNIPKPPSGL